MNIVGSNFNLIGLSESWLKPCVSDAAVSIANYNLVRSDRLIGRGGVCIFESFGLKYKLVFKVSVDGCETLFIEVMFNNVKILFGVVYLSHGDIIEFERLHHDLFSTYSNIIIVGDFNTNIFDFSKSYMLRMMCLRCNLS